MKKLLLHTCCAPCAIYPIQELSQEYEVTIYFYDPNIHPKEEYIARRDEMKRYAKKLNINFEEGEYNDEEWFKKTKGLEQEPEKGKRCETCFGIRLGETAKKAKKENYDIFATALSISPHKDYKQISRTGNILVNKFNINFLDRDWKKKDGFKKSCELSREEDFYRQDYCGCVYSKRDNILE